MEVGPKKLARKRLSGQGRVACAPSKLRSEVGSSRFCAFRPAASKASRREEKREPTRGRQRRMRVMRDRRYKARGAASRVRATSRCAPRRACVRRSSSTRKRFRTAGFAFEAGRPISCACAATRSARWGRSRRARKRRACCRHKRNKVCARRSRKIAARR